MNVADCVISKIFLQRLYRVYFYANIEALYYRGVFAKYIIYLEC